MSNSNRHHVLKTCLAYYWLVPLVGAVGHVSQTVTVNHNLVRSIVLNLGRSVVLNLVCRPLGALCST